MEDYCVVVEDYCVAVKDYDVSLVHYFVLEGGGHLVKEDGFVE